MGPLPSLLRWLLTGVFPSHQGPGRWKALSQLSGKHLEGMHLKSVGGLSEGRGDCAGTYPSPGSREGGGLWPRHLATLGWVPPAALWADVLP